MNVDLRLIQKYNVAAPRYTSYPPATHFVEMHGERKGSGELSLYFHLPFCWQRCWYCGCTNVTTENQAASAEYIQYIRRELEITKPRKGPVVQLHLGGGTPTFLLPSEIEMLGKMIRSHFTLDEEVEASVEIDPRRLTREHVTALRGTGFQRASIGIQDFDPAVQEAVHRMQSREQTQNAIKWLREAGFSSLNFDLIYGLPHQTAASFSKTLDEVIALRPERLAVFNYAHVPWLKPTQNLLTALPSPEEKLELLKLTVERLTTSGYIYIGMDHFALADDELAIAQRKGTLQRNFQGYSTRGNTDIYGFGMSAISQTADAYWQNVKDLAAYYKALDDGRSPIVKGYILTKDDQIRRKAIMQLMCNLYLDFNEYFAAEFASLDDLEADGLIASTKNGITVTDLGRLLIRNIAVRFDKYFGKQTSVQFSRSI